MNSIYHIVVNMNLVKRFGGHLTTSRAATFMHETNNFKKCFVNYVNLW